jgi:protein-arginine kinase activator protein McsA
MLCESCQKNVAVVHITEVRDESPAQLNLCAECSERRDETTRSQDIPSSGWTSYGPGDVRFDR